MINLIDLIYIERNLLSADECDTIINENVNSKTYRENSLNNNLIHDYSGGIVCDVNPYEKSIDILTNKNFHHPILYRGRHTKPLNVLWGDEVIGRKYNQYNTIIIDNNTDVTNISPRNSVNIDDFEYPDEIDNSLYKLKKWLKKIILYKDLRKVKKPIFNPCGYELPRVVIDDNDNLLLENPNIPIKKIKIKKKSSMSKKNKRKIKRNIKP